MKHRQIVHEAVVIAVLTSHQFCFPGHIQVSLDFFIVAASIHQGITGHGVTTRLAQGVRFTRVRAVPVKAGMLVFVFLEEIDDALGHHSNAVGSITKQIIIHTEVHGAAHGVVHIFCRRRGIFIMRRSVKVVIFREQARGGVRALKQMISSFICCFRPFILIGIRPASE